MAEAMLRTWGGDRFDAFSAGTEATGIRPETIQVMEEIGISLTGHWSKTIEEFRGQSFEWFITVCDEAQKNCPVLPGVENVGHWSIVSELLEGETLRSILAGRKLSTRKAIDYSVQIAHGLAAAHEAGETGHTQGKLALTVSA